MREVRAFGTYYRSNGHLFRKTAYLQFGHSSKSIGSIIMLNPGKAVLLNEANVVEDKEVSGEVSLDKTMTRLVDILQQSSEIPLDGRFYIYNLFSIQNTSSKDSVKQKRWLKEAALKNIDIINQFQLEQHPWVLLAWSTEKGANLQKLKEQWLTIIEESNIKVFGIKAKGKHMYYHPYPRILAHKERYMQEIVKQLKFDESISLFKE